MTDTHFHERLVSLLDYDFFSGKFYMRAGANGEIRGREVGCIGTFCNKQYRVVSVDGKSFLAHRLAIFYMTGVIPCEEVDHIDGDGLNNSATNLRVVSRAENLRNQKIYKNNKSGRTGVHFCLRTNKWWAGISVKKGVRVRRGFNTFEDAADYRQMLEIEHGYHPNHGRAA